MKNDTLKQYLALRQKLEDQKAALQGRLVQIDKVLSGVLASPGRKLADQEPVLAPRGRRRGRRPRNALSLRQAVLQVTKTRAMTKAEILAAIAELGYRFAAKNPVNSLNTVLYTKKQFKNSKGRFSPAK